MDLLSMRCTLASRNSALHLRRFFLLSAEGSGEDAVGGGAEAGGEGTEATGGEGGGSGLGGGGGVIGGAMRVSRSEGGAPSCGRINATGAVNVGVSTRRRSASPSPGCSIYPRSAWPRELGGGRRSTPAALSSARQSTPLAIKASPKVVSGLLIGVFSHDVRYSLSCPPDPRAPRAREVVSDLFLGEFVDH